MPHFETISFWERVMIPVWAWVTQIFTVVYRVNDPKSPAAMGIGGFFLMRRSILDRIGGYEALKDEVLEDVRLAEMIKSSGGKMLNAHAPHLLRTRMYRTLGEMWESCTKSWFAGVKFFLPLALLSVFTMYLIAVMPPLIALASTVGILVFHFDLWALLLPSIASWLFQILVLVWAGWKSGVSAAYAFTAPLGLALLYLMLFESSIRIKIGKGVTWKGRRVYERGGVAPPPLDWRPWVKKTNSASP
jgi:hypothetical protein